MLEKQDLQAIQQLIQSTIEPLRQDIQSLKADVSALQDDVTIIKSDVKDIKSNVRFNRKSEIDIINYIDNRIDEKIERLRAELTNKTA